MDMEKERGYSPNAEDGFMQSGPTRFDFYEIEEEEAEEDEHEKKLKMILAYASLGYEPSNIAYMCELTEEEVEEILEEEGIEYKGE